MSHRILVVDDAPSVTGVLEFLLEAEGYDVQIVGDGRDAVASASARPPDLILLDLGVPGLDGYQVTARLNEDPMTATIPIMLLTGSQESVGSPRLAGYPVKDVVLKPFSPKELLVRIKRVLDGE